MLFSPYFFFSDLVRLSYCSFSACSACPVPPCPVIVLSGLPVTLLSRHVLLPSCPFLTVLFLPFRSCLVNVQADLAQCLYRLHTAILDRPLSSAATMEVQGPDKHEGGSRVFYSYHAGGGVWVLSASFDLF